MTSIDLTPYLASGSEAHSAVIVCPGGGHWHLADHEGEPIAAWLNSQGISAFLLRYSLAPNRHPAPLNDLQTAIRTVRTDAAKYNIDPARVGVLGFSAGGHLTSTAATHFDYGDPNADDPLLRASSRPDAIVLCYAVISFQEFTHEGTILNLFGEEPDEKGRASLSNHLHVTADSPPAFLWHTADDTVVPVEHCLMYASALSRNNVPFELHVFPHGRHGVGLASDDPILSQWTSLCAVWLKSNGF